MEIVRCENGHFYDMDKYSSCPTCAKEMSEVGPTVPASEMAFVSSQLLGDYGPTEPMTSVDNRALEISGEMMADAKTNVPNNGIQDYQPTLPVTPAGGQFSFNPIVGWLVCVEGPDQGKDYRIRSQYNFIGRAAHMDICIRSDNHISNDRAAIIAYDPQERMFTFGPGTGHNLVRVNGKMILNAVELKAYDEVTIGRTKLLFVPLCGERFNWNGE